MKTRIPIYEVANKEIFNFLNPNAFPQSIRSLVLTCYDHLTITLTAISITKTEIQNSIPHMLDFIQKDPSWKGSSPKNNPNKPFTYLYHNPKVHLGFNAVLIHLKAFLDVYSKIIVRLIQPHSKIAGFRKKKIDGFEICGGALLNWLEKTCPSDYTHKPKLIDLLKNNITQWIQEAIRIRDIIVHYNTLFGNLDLSIYLDKELNEIGPNDIIIPILPNKKNILEYFDSLEENFIQFIKKTLKLLPNIDFTILKL